MSDQSGCDWHTHSMFYPCPNGQYVDDYLVAAMREPRRAHLPTGLDDKTLTAAQGQIDNALLQALDFEQPCEFADHDIGHAGCRTGDPAAFVVYMSHGIDPTQCEPVYILACTGRALWLTENRDHKAGCPTCKTEGPLRRFAFVVGPIDPKS